MDDKNSFSFPKSESAGGIDYRSLQISDAVLRRQGSSVVLAQFAALLRDASVLSALLSSVDGEQSGPHYNPGDIASLANVVSSSLEVFAYVSGEHVPRDMVRWIKLVKDKGALLSRIDRQSSYEDIDPTDI